MIDLSWGHPYFMQEVLKDAKLTLDGKLSGLIPYPFAPSTQPELERILRLLHPQHANDALVIGAGASQLITAAMAASHTSAWTMDAPYWGRYGEILGTFSYPKNHSVSVQIHTSPANPTGEQPPLIKRGKTVIHDAVYNWPHYTPTPLLYHEADATLYSFGKLTGLSGVRLGWMFCKDAQYAKELERYIELTTCGVSTVSQLTAVHVLSFFIKQPELIQKAKKVLDDRWASLAPFSSILGHSGASQGMFYWGRMNKPEAFFLDRGIKVSPGSYFGCSDDYYRVNIGCSASNFEEFINAIQKP